MCSQLTNVFFSLSPLFTVSVEFGRAVWLRFYPPAFPPCPNPSFVAHLGGVMVGLTLGVVVLQNYEQRLHEQSLFWIFFCVYTLFVLCAVFWNIFAYSLLDVRLPPPPWLVYQRQIRHCSPFTLPSVDAWAFSGWVTSPFIIVWAWLWGDQSWLTPSSYIQWSDTGIPDLQQPIWLVSAFLGWSLPSQPSTSCSSSSSLDACRTFVGSNTTGTVLFTQLNLLCLFPQSNGAYSWRHRSVKVFLHNCLLCKVTAAKPSSILCCQTK